MAQKTSVTGNRVTIDDCAYDLKQAGTDRFAVHDEFGGALGHIVIQGKNLEVDDYGVAGAHPLALIGKLYQQASAGGPEAKRPASRMVCQVVKFEHIEEADLEKAHAYRRWLKTQPGLKVAFFTHDPATGKAQSIRVWSSREQMVGAAARVPPAGASEPASSSMEVSPLAEDV